MNETDREELQDRLLVPSMDQESPALAPNIPLIMTRLEQTASGLLIPATPERQPLDMLATYLTGELLTGSTIDLDEIKRVMGQQPSLSLVGGLAHLTRLMEMPGVMDAAFEGEYVEVCCPPDLRTRMQVALNERGTAASSPQVGLAAQKLAIKNSTGQADDAIAWPVFGALLLAVGDHMAERTDDRDALELEVTRYSIFYTHPNPHLLWGRHERMWNDIAPRLTAHPKYMDVNALLEDATGTPAHVYLAMLFALFFLFYRKKSIVEEPLWVDTSPLPDQIRLAKEEIDDVLAATAGSLDWFRDTISDDNLPWDFTAFQKRPLVVAGDLVFPPSLDLLLQKQTTGVYYTILDHLRERSGDWRGWQIFFGHVWEEYVRELLLSSVDKSRLVSESQLEASWPENAKRADNLLLYPDRWLLVETVGKRMSLATAATGTPESLNEDLTAAVLKKARQLSSTIDVLTESPEASGISMGEYPSRYRPMIVLPGPFPNMPHVVTQFRELISADDECKALAGDHSEPVLVLSSDDIELLLGTSATLGASLIELIDRWQESSLKDLSAEIWLYENERSKVSVPAWLDEASRRFTQSCTARLFGSSDTKANS